MRECCWNSFHLSVIWAKPHTWSLDYRQRVHSICEECSSCQSKTSKEIMYVSNRLCAWVSVICVPLMLSCSHSRNRKLCVQRKKMKEKKETNKNDRKKDATHTLWAARASCTCTLYSHHIGTILNGYNFPDSLFFCLYHAHINLTCVSVPLTAPQFSQRIHDSPLCGLYTQEFHIIFVYVDSFSMYHLISILCFHHHL